MTTLALKPGRQMPMAAGMRLPDYREDVPAGDVAALAATLDAVDLSVAPSMELLARAVGWERLIAAAKPGRPGCSASCAHGARSVPSAWRTSCRRHFRAPPTRRNGW